MAKRRIVFWGLGIAVGLSLLALASVLLFPLSPLTRSAITTVFDPDCEDRDEACQLWAAFRGNHPYPYQSFGFARLQHGRVLLVASEPPPDISHVQAIGLFNELFADRAPQTTTRKWFTGADGYVEVVLVEFSAPELNSDDLLQAPELRDRVALLHLTWYGTTYGGNVEPILRNRLKRTAAIAPNLSVTASELRTWLADATIGWSAIESDDSSVNTWADLVKAGSTHAYRSADGTLVLLTFPAAVLRDRAAL
jgi:hypothetical protein